MASGAHFWWGVTLATAAMVCWTTFAMLNAAWLKRHPELSAGEWANWLGIATGVGALLLWLLAGSSSQELLALDNISSLGIICAVAGVGSAWLASILWNIASQRLSVSLCGQLIVSETLFALLYSYLWDRAWPGALPASAAVLFTLGILASIRAHR
jgi:drug/metabolite transporter (DMT)-like permease